MRMIRRANEGPWMVGAVLEGSPLILLGVGAAGAWMTAHPGQCTRREVIGTERP
jgi:hypothetical protein